MKKCFVLGEMLNQANINKFKKLRILVRNPTKIIPTIGTVSCAKYNFNGSKEYVYRNHVSAKKKMVQVLAKILNREFDY